MHKLIYSLLFLAAFQFLILPVVRAEDPVDTLNMTKSITNDLKNIIKDNSGIDKTEGNIRLKMVTRIVAGAVLIVGIICTVAVQFKVISMGLGTVSEKPETLGGLIILMLLPESIVLLSFVISTLLLLI